MFVSKGVVLTILLYERRLSLCAVFGHGRSGKRNEAHIGALSLGINVGWSTYVSLHAEARVVALAAGDAKDARASQARR